MRRSASSGSTIAPRPVASPDFARQSAALRRLDNQIGEPLAAAAIEAVGLRIFVEQKFKFVGVTGSDLAADQRRRQMADGHAGDAALGLRGFAGITDDERIDHGERAGDDFGKHAAVSATALPGSHSSVPCAPICTSASAFTTCCSHSPKATSACRGGSAGS